VSYITLVEDKLYFFKEQKADGKSVSESAQSTLRWIVLFRKFC